MPSIPPMLVALAAVAGALAAWTGVMVTVLMVLWNKLDKRFDDLEARQNKRFDQQDRRFEELEARQDKRFDQQDKRFEELEARQDKRFDELKAEMQEGRAEVRALREALLSIKA